MVLEEGNQYMNILQYFLPPKPWPLIIESILV